MAVNFDGQRAEVRTEIEARQREASQAYEDLLTAAADQVKEAWNKGVRAYVETVEPKRTQELGPDAVKALKTDLVALEARCRSTVQAELDKLSVWDNYRKDDAPQYHDDTYSGFRNFHQRVRYVHPATLPQPVAVAIATACAKADDLLRKHGWGKTPTNQRGPGLVRLPHEPTQQMLDAMFAFSHAADQIAKGRDQLAAIDKAESEHTAKAIWDDA